MPRNPAAEAKRLAAEVANIAGLRVVPVEDESTWPEPMGPEAFVGLAGDFVRAVEPHTESDRAALLGNFLVGSGVLIGREAWAFADGQRHYAVESLLVTGSTGSGRKGTATGRVLPLLEAVDENFRTAHTLRGLSSGEGLIKAVSSNANHDLPGVTSYQTYLVLLSEFGGLLAVMKREGNTLSSVLRDAWDCVPLHVLTRKEPLHADNVNLSFIANVTPTELLNSLTATDKANGFANRFLILLARRSKLLPEGGGEVNLSPIVARLHAAVEAAKGRGRIDRDAAARELWAEEYKRLTRPRDGMRGELCGRAEAHVLRLSLVYALLDSSDCIRPEHLEAAVAFWDYCERSVNHIFGGASGDADRQKIVSALAGGPLTLTELRRVFNNNKDAEWIKAKMAMLVRAGIVVQTTKEGERKSSLQAWALTPGAQPHDAPRTSTRARPSPQPPAGRTAAAHRRTGGSQCHSARPAHRSCNPGCGA